MIFTTWLYGLFLVVTVGVFWALPARARRWWLVGAGLVFYTNYHPPHLWLIAVLTALVYAAARVAVRAGPAVRRGILALAIALSLGVLGYYKYTLFAFATLVSVGLTPPVAALALIPTRAPLAISFFVFEYVHWLIEVRRGRFGPGSPRDFLLFILFFPSLISGPIKRFDAFQPQIEHPGPADVGRGAERVIVGLAKKLLVADTAARLVGPLWEAPLEQPWWLLWLMVYGYAVQILFDFSGYSDIAIGSALLFGFRIPENFNYPYLQPNVARFWRSWHMSLTSWVTDYVYVPLGGNRRGALRAQANRLVAMALVGLWHGAGGHFVLWGLYHGVGLNLYHAYRALRVRLPLPPDLGLPGRIAGTVLTFHFVCVGWVLFVLDAAKARLVIQRLLGMG